MLDADYLLLRAIVRGDFSADLNTRAHLIPPSPSFLRATRRDATRYRASRAPGASRARAKDARRLKRDRRAARDFS